MTIVVVVVQNAIQVKWNGTEFRWMRFIVFSNRAIASLLFGISANQSDVDDVGGNGNGNN